MSDTSPTPPRSPAVRTPWLQTLRVYLEPASLGGQLLTLQFSRSDESDADLVGLELAARGGYQPSAAVSLWQKMGNATGGKQGGLAFLSTHPSGPARIRELEQNVPRVQGLYEAARRNG